MIVSIHAPARGATRKGTTILSEYSFNPRARKGRDLSPQPLLLLSSVSIHAPARGATHMRKN